MADASNSPETPTDATSEAPSAQDPDARKGRRKLDDAPWLTTRTRLTHDLRSALQTHQAEVTEALEELLDPFVDDGERLELATLFRAVDRLVADRQAQRVLRLLQDANHPRPEPKVEGASFDWDRWIDKLETPTRELDRALKEKVAESKVTHGSLRDKHLDLERFDRNVHAAARWIAATFELADRESYGRSLRPFARSPRRRSKTKTQEEPPSEQAGDGAAKEIETTPAPPSVSAKGVSKEALGPRNRS